MSGTPRAVFCHGGPLDGHGFTDEGWRVRVEAAKAMGRSTANYTPHRLGDSEVKLPAVLDKYDVTVYVWRGEA